MSTMRRFNHPPIEQLELPRILHALSDPARLRILRALAAQGEQTCGALMGDRPKSSMSHHFRALRDAGVIKTRTIGTLHYNSLRLEDIESRFPGMIEPIIKAVGEMEPPEDEPV